MNAASNSDTNNKLQDQLVNALDKYKKNQKNTNSDNNQTQDTSSNDIEIKPVQIPLNMPIQAPVIEANSPIDLSGAMTYHNFKVDYQFMNPKETTLSKIKNNLIKLKPGELGNFGWVDYNGIIYTCEKIYFTSPAVHKMFDTRVSLEMQVHCIQEYGGTLILTQLFQKDPTEVDYEEFLYNIGFGQGR